MKDMRPDWRRWLRAAVKDNRVPLSPASLGMCTGQDWRALGAIAACWELYASSDEDGGRAAIEAIRALLGGMQPKCHVFARELIAYAMDWGDREKLWPLVDPTQLKRELEASAPPKREGS